MAKKTVGPVISFESLLNGYTLTIDNAFKFFEVAGELLKDYPDKALALAQIGQEEIVKSLTILAAFSFGKRKEEWNWFWGNWNNHQLKGHRAYLYEIISPKRIEVITADGTLFSGFPLRPKLSQEKECGFYVDYDSTRQIFVSPSTEVTLTEAASRLMTLTYLLTTAERIHSVLVNKKLDFRLPAFGEIAFLICSQVVYQQDMPGILALFRTRSDQYEALAVELEIALASHLDFMADIKKPNRVLPA